METDTCSKTIKKSKDIRNSLHTQTNSCYSECGEKRLGQEGCTGDFEGNEKVQVLQRGHEFLGIYCIVILQHLNTFHILVYSFIAVIFNLKMFKEKTNK